MLQVVYGESMVLPVDQAPGPGAHKAAAVMALAGEGVKRIPPPGPASVEMLELAHDPEYVRQVLSGEWPNGFGTFDPAVTLQARTCVAAMCKAVDLALEQKTIVCAPVSGFHHAGYRSAWGFCTFNGLIIAALNARKTRDLPNILIIDGDGHYGDGTYNILKTLNPPGIVSVSTTIEDPLRWDSVGLHTMLYNEKPWDLILYQAGADAHKDDPFGAGYLNDTEWFWRDSQIFDASIQHDIPLVFNFAGGYAGEKTTNLHYHTINTARGRLVTRAQRSNDVEPHPMRNPKPFPYAHVKRIDDPNDPMYGLYPIIDLDSTEPPSQ